MKNLDSVRQEETEFERSYSDWLKQYNEWKDANRSEYGSTMQCYFVTF